MENIEYQSTITDWINTSKIYKPPKIFFLNWVRTVFRILIQLYVSIKMKENESKSKQN